MKNKIIMMLIGMVLFSGIALAIQVEEGQILTQAQLDGVDASTLTKQDLQCQMESWGFVTEIDGSNATRIIAVRFGFSCLSIVPELDGSEEPTGDYEVVRSPIDVVYKKSRFRLCREDKSAVACLLDIEDYVRGHYNHGVQLIRLAIMDFQTDDFDTFDWGDLHGDI